MKYIQITILILVVSFLISSCQSPGGDTPGSEFMPDMAHSVAYESNYYNYYYNNTWGTEEEYYSYAKPKLPSEGTVPRGSASNISIPKANDTKPYRYGNTIEERERAISEIIDNPLPITEAGLVQGKELYEIFCGICHGNKGDGLGYIYDVTEAYPIAPKRFLKGTTGIDSLDYEMVRASNGRYYHAIMRGINLMGAYNDKLNYEERWNVIHYIRSLQAKDMKLEYNQTTNTLNNIDRPAGNKNLAELVKSDSDSDSHDGMDHDAQGHDKEAGMHDSDHSTSGGQDHSNEKHK
jgi:mono/diheme cytochrome c family protein